MLRKDFEHLGEWGKTAHLLWAVAHFSQKTGTRGAKLENFMPKVPWDGKLKDRRYAQAIKAAKARGLKLPLKGVSIE